MTGQNHLLERAHLLLQQRRFKDAETTIRQLLEQEPRNDEALALLGRCYLNNNKIDEGIRAVKEAITIAPNTAFYFYLLGFGYYQKSIYDTASQNLWKGINLNPYEPEYFGLLAFVH